MSKYLLIIIVFSLISEKVYPQASNISSIRHHREFPIKPSRTIKFTVDEGSFLRVIVSPKGDSLVFNLLGDIYIVASEGGRARQVTRGVAMYSNPKWEINGRLIYDSDEFEELNISTIHSARSETLPKPFGLGEPNISNLNFYDTISTKDGRWKLFFKNEQLFAIDNSSKEERSIHKGKASFSGDKSISQDSKYVYCSFDGKIHRIEISTGKDIIVPFFVEVNVDCGKLNLNQFSVNQLPFDIKYARLAQYNPKRNQVVFSALNRIYIQDIAPSKKGRILSKQNINQYQPVISPDGKWVAFVSWEDSIGGALWKVSISGGAPEKLTIVPGQYQRPAWSPDGKSIAVLKGKAELKDRDDAGIGDLMVINISNKRAKTIVSNIPLWNSLAFSKDGQYISYVPSRLDDHRRPDKKEQPQLVKVSLADKSIKKLVTGRFDFTPKYLYQFTISPDSQYLVYCRAEELYVTVKAKGEDLFLLHESETSALRFAIGVDPFWSADGKVVSWTYGDKIFSLNTSKLIQALQQSTEGQTNILQATKEIKLAVRVPVSTGKGLLAFTNARIITMHGKQVIDNGFIKIQDGKILSVGDMNEFSHRQGGRSIDLKGKTIIPGLIDLHCHVRVPPDVFPQQSWMLKAYLAYGVTTARDPSQGFDSFGYEELLKSGQMLGPRLFSVGRAVRPLFGIRTATFEDARLIAEKRKQMGGISIKQYALPTRLQRQFLLLATDQAGLNMTNEGLNDALGQIAMIKDGSGGIEHTPFNGNEDVLKDLIKLYAKSKVWLTPTLQVSSGLKISEMSKEYFKYYYWKDADAKLRRFIFSDPTQTKPIPTTNHPESLQTILFTTKPSGSTLRSLRKASEIIASIYNQGGKIGMGSHGNNPGIGAHNEIWALQMGGLTNLEALRIATINGAEAMGIQKDLGSIKAGKIADLIILNANPLDDIHNTRDILYVMKDGVLYDDETLEVLWPSNKYK